MVSASNCWKKIVSEIGSTGREFETWGRYWGYNNKFRVRAEKNIIVVDGPSISSPRIITFTEFECVAALYDDYIKGVKGIRNTMRDDCGRNSSYIITLIHEYC